MRTLEVRAYVVLALVLAACAINVAPSAAEELPTEPKCEFIASPGSSECMLPFPDDYYTKADATSPTGRRIDFRELAMPRNASGAPIEAAPYNTGDGFSPGSVIALKIPGIETVADVNAKNQQLQAPEGFRFYRDDLPSSEEKVNLRRAHFEELFFKLEAAGVQRSTLYLAWDFTVASDQNNTGRELDMRNAAFSTLGDNNLANGIVEGTSPTFTVTSVENEPNPGEIARRVMGDLVVPCYLFPSCGPGGTMVLSPEGTPL